MEAIMNILQKLTTNRMKILLSATIILGFSLPSLGFGREKCTLHNGDLDFSIRVGEKTISFLMCKSFQDKIIELEHAQVCQFDISQVISGLANQYPISTKVHQCLKDISQYFVYQQRLKIEKLESELATSRAQCGGNSTSVPEIEYHQQAPAD